MRMRHMAPIAAAAVLALTVSDSASAQDTCRQGYVWREAYPGDVVCVTPETRAQAAEDNRQAAARRQPGGGDYGPNTCRQGFVWREARPGDVVCVTPETRSQAAHDNAQAASRRAAASPSTGAAATKPVESAVAGYIRSDWSSWAQRQGLAWRYRWGLDPKQTRKPQDLDVTFEVRNRLTEAWEGEVRTLDCERDMVSRSRRISLHPNASTVVTLKTPNCGTRERPELRPTVAKSHRID